MSIHKKQKHFYLQPVNFAIMVLFVISATNISAAPITLSQQPAGNGGKEPAPNVIISVDDSGSMGGSVSGAAVTTANPKKMTALKTALITQFGDGSNAANKGNIPDGSIRLAWQSMCNSAGNNSNTLGLGAANSMKSFTGSGNGSHRKNFGDFVNALAENCTTPAHNMVRNAHNYMSTTPASAGANSPWANEPGTAQITPYLACRRAYHIFMTDGGWNLGAVPAGAANRSSGGNSDGTATTLGDGTTSYTPFTNQTNVYSDNAGDANLSTVSDFAFKSWAQDLQPSMANSVRPLIKQSGTETVGTSVLQQFWNPKNDPATWQHLVTHTIGFGNGAVAWTNNAGTALIAPFWNSVTDNNYSGDYSALVAGTTTWPNALNLNENGRPVELWHMALNGRGKFYPARTAASLTAAFNDILNNIIADTSKPLVSIAANGSRLKAGLYAYQAGYNGTDWAGRLLAYPINSTTASIGTTAAWSATGNGALDANGKFIVNDAGKLDDPAYSVANRFVASYSGTTGIEWKTFTSLPSAQQLALSKNSSGVVDTNGQNRVDYLRGNRTKEASETGGIFRNRSSRLGDIVNSNILYVGKPVADYGEADYKTFKSTTGVGNRTPMVYVGANDGMLHGFDAATGVEKLAYIPQGIAQGDLRKLTDTTYTHQYFVDGTPFTSDAKVGNIASSSWKTVLVSGLSGGGKGYFALDASNPSNFTATNVANLVIADTTALVDPDIGNMYITPAMDDFIVGKSDQIVRLNAPTSGTAPNQIKYRWALVLGNGYNSTNEAPVLVVQYLDGAREIKKISPCITVSTGVFDTTCAYKTGNGLSTPRLVDLNADGVADVAYAGDLNGNVWKFDLSSTNNGNWKTSFSNAPFFKAKSGQSFTTAPYVASNDVAGFGVVVNINSGRNLTTADQSTTTQETVYTLWDNSTFKDVAVTPATTPATYKLQITDSTSISTPNALPGTLVQQTINTTTFVDKGFTYFTSSSNPVNYTGTTPKRGWYMDWAGVPGQRVLQNSKAFDGQKIQINSTKPSSVVGSANEETCTPATNGERTFLTILNLFSGNPSKSVVYDLTPTVATSNPNTTTIEGNPAGDTVGFRTDEGIKFVPPCPEGTTCAPPTELKFGKYVGARANWREKK